MSEKVALPSVATMGEPAGVGGEIALRGWVKIHQTNFPFCIIDCPYRLERVNNSLNIGAKIARITNIDDALKVFQHALPVLPIKLPGEVVAGKLNPSNSPAVLTSIKQATKLVQEGKAQAMITNPIHKSALRHSGFAFPGHTEYLASLTKTKTEPVMMLLSDRLRVIPITRHVSIQEAIKLINPSLIVSAALAANQSLQQDFGIIQPRIVITGLNPHAGENGIMGDEEETKIQPAINDLVRMGLNVIGPLSADSLFHKEARKNYDVALCMYHDQALIPIKTLDFDVAVNLTLGLPFIRTSPDHGTALDIANKGCANEKSFVAAIQLATKMAFNRSKGLSAND